MTITTTTILMGFDTIEINLVVVVVVKIVVVVVVAIVNVIVAALLVVTVVPTCRNSSFYLSPALSSQLLGLLHDLFSQLVHTLFMTCS